MRSEGLPGGWTHSRMDELADLAWGDTSTTKASYTDEGFPAFSASGQDGLLPYFDYERDGVVLSAIGANCGRVYFARGRWSCIKNTIRFWGRASSANTRFLYYATSSPAIWPRRGSAQPFISQGDARAVQIAVPTNVAEQHRIAAVLGALDDKIDSNHRLAALLEETAATLFRAQFVDFVGVEEFEESEIGPIPRGWSVVSAYDVARVTYGRPFKSSHFDASDGTPVLRIRDLAADATSIRTTETRDDARLVSPGDIVVGMDGEFRAHAWAGPHAWLNQRVCAFDPLDGVSRAFVLESIRKPLRFLEATKGGTTVIHLGKRDIDSFRLVSPPPAVMRRFADDADPLLDLSVAVRTECRTLSAIRDALLPKLISGEMRVPDTSEPEEVIGPAAEEFVSAAS